MKFYKLKRGHSFLQIYQKHYDRVFPMKAKVIKTKSFNNPGLHQK